MFVQVSYEYLSLIFICYNNFMTTIVIVLVVLFALLIYFLPTVIAYNRSIKGRGWIFILNILLAETGVAYIILLIWACTAEKQYIKHE